MEIAFVIMCIVLNVFCDLTIARILLPLACWAIATFGIYEEEEDE